jgi:hydroxymethylglutaryl-CoA lyase
MQFPPEIRIRDVSPRDGLQAEPAQLRTDDKVRLVDMLSVAGVPQINVTAFVSPRRVPNMADAAEVMSRIERRPGVRYDATVPNAMGAERAIEAGADAVVTFVAASEQANLSNVGRTTDAALRQAEQVITLARSAGIGAIGTVSSAFGSPYGEEISVQDVLRIALRLAESGATGLALGDTSGEATPGQVHGFVSRCLAEIPGVELSLHLHDTRGLALANAVAAMDAGATNFDGAVGGIGGSPFTRNSAGNLATDDLVEMCRRMGIRTGIDQSVLLRIHRFLESRLGHPLDSRAGRLAEGLEATP